ncbi:MAG: hypothetical protein AAF074_25010 [Pseudomonadota bacterium]
MPERPSHSEPHPELHPGSHLTPALTPDLTAAMEALLEELARATAAEAEARAALEAARTRHHAVSSAADRLLRLFSGPAEASFRARIAWAAGRQTPRRPRVPRDPRLRETYRFLAERGDRPFRVADLTAHLEAHGHRLAPQSAANTCRHLACQGVLARMGYGVYSAITASAALVEYRFSMLQEG